MECILVVLSVFYFSFFIFILFFCYKDAYARFDRLLQNIQFSPQKNKFLNGRNDYPQLKAGTKISENQPRESAFRLVEATPNYELSEGASGISRNTTECNHSPRKKYRDWSRVFSSPGNKPTSSNYCAGGPSSSTYQWARTSADPNCSNENFNSKDVNYWTNVFFPTTKNSRESSNIPTTSFLNQRNDLLSYRNLNESSTAAENENPILPPYNSSHNPLRRKNLTGSKPISKSNYQTNSELFSTIDLIGGGSGNSGGDNNADNSSFLQV